MMKKKFTRPYGGLILFFFFFIERVQLFQGEILVNWIVLQCVSVYNIFTRPLVVGFYFISITQNTAMKENLFGSNWTIIK